MGGARRLELVYETLAKVYILLYEIYMYLEYTWYHFAG